MPRKTIKTLLIIVILALSAAFLAYIFRCFISENAPFLTIIVTILAAAAASTLVYFQIKIMKQQADTMEIQANMSYRQVSLEEIKDLSERFTRFSQSDDPVSKAQATLFISIVSAKASAYADNLVTQLLNDPYLSKQDKKKIFDANEAYNKQMSAL